MLGANAPKPLWISLSAESEAEGSAPATPRCLLKKAGENFNACRRNIWGQGELAPLAGFQGGALNRVRGEALTFYRLLSQRSQAAGKVLSTK